MPGTFLNIGVAPITRTSNGTSPLVTWFGGSNWPFGCALSRVSGVLGSGSRIETYVGLSGDNRRWNLSQTQPLFLALSSTAYCIQ